MSLTSDISSLHGKTSYMIKPIQFYPMLQVMKSGLAFTMFFILSFSIAIILWYINQPKTSLAALVQPYSYVPYITLVLSLIGLVSVYIYHYLEYTQIKYVFSQLGISIEQGINFSGDFVSWKQINDVNIKRSLVQRMMGSGTIELECTDFSTKRLEDVAQSKELYYYLKQKVGKQLASARRIVRG